MHLNLVSDRKKNITFFFNFSLLIDMYHVSFIPGGSLLITSVSPHARTKRIKSKILTCTYLFQNILPLSASCVVNLFINNNNITEISAEVIIISTTWTVANFPLVLNWSRFVPSISLILHETSISKEYVGINRNSLTGYIFVRMSKQSNKTFPGNTPFSKLIQTIKDSGTNKAEKF